MPTIKFTIPANMTKPIQMETDGFKGEACLASAQKYTQALGSQSEDVQFKSEMYETEDAYTTVEG